MADRVRLILLILAVPAIGIAASIAIRARTSHPTDSHPPLAVRLEALSVEMSSVAADALFVRPPESAAALVPNCDEREAALSQDYQLLLASQFGIRLEPTTEAGKAALQSSPIRECWSCGTHVLPTRKNTCPSCGEEMLPQK